VETLKCVLAAKDKAKSFKTFKWGDLVCRCNSLVESAEAGAKCSQNNVQAAKARDLWQKKNSSQ